MGQSTRCGGHSRPGDHTFRLSVSAGSALIVISALAMLSPLWLDRDIVYSKHSDIISEHLSMKAVGQRSLTEEGRFPLWNPSMNCGAPAFANPQSMYVFPFDLLYLVLPIERATNLVCLLNVILAGMGMYLFGRRFFRDPTVALFCAIAYMFSFHCLAMVYTGWLPKMSMYALVPLMFWACAGLLERPTLRRTVWLALVVVLCGLQGDMQLLYYAAIGCGVYVLVRLIGMEKSLRWRAIGGLLLGGLLGVMLTMPALLPRWEFVRLSTRTSTDYEFFLRQSPQPAELATFLRPDTGAGRRNEFWENNFYFGLFLLPFWLVALGGSRDLRQAGAGTSRRRLPDREIATKLEGGPFPAWVGRRRALFLLIAAVVGIFLCFDTPILKALYAHLPGFAMFRQPSRLLLLVQFVLVLLAGVGLETLLELHHPRILRGLFAIAVILTALYCAFLAIRSGAAVPALLAIAAMLLFLGLWSLFTRARKYGLVGLACLLPVADAAWQIRPLIKTAPLEDIGYERIATYDDLPVFVTYKGVQKRRVLVWQQKDPLGPAYFAQAVRAVKSEDQSLIALAESTNVRAALVFNPDRVTDGLDFAGGDVKLVHRGLNHYQYEFDSRGSNYLILSQVWYPGWRARLDGEPVRLYRTNHALMGCFVPSGRHELTLDMTSPSMMTGMIFAGAGLLGMITLIVVSVRKNSA